MGRDWWLKWNIEDGGSNSSVVPYPDIKLTLNIVKKIKMQIQY